MQDPKIGRYNADGTITWPTQTLWGAPLDPPASGELVAHIYRLSDNRIAVGDDSPPRGFDVQAALRDLDPGYGQQETRFS